MEAHWQRCDKLAKALRQKTDADTALNRADYVVSARRYLHTVKTLKARKDDKVFSFSSAHIGNLSDQYASLAENVEKIGDDDESDASQKLVEEELDKLYGELVNGIRASDDVSRAKTVFDKKHKQLTPETPEDKSLREAMLTEAFVMWVTSFGKKTSVSFTDWWEAFIGHMTSVYGFHEANPYDGVRDAVKNVIDVGNDISITVGTFRDFLLRFGPFKNVFLRSCPFTDKRTLESKIFLPTSDAGIVRTHFRANTDSKFIVRFASKPGNLTRECDDRRKQQIFCSPTGYCALTDGSPGKGKYTILCESPAKVLQFFKHYDATRDNLNEWETYLDALYGNTNNYGHIDNDADEENKTNAENTKAIVSKLEELAVGVRDLRMEFQQVALRLLCDLKGNMPKQFIIWPDAGDKADSKDKKFKSFVKNCKRKVKEKFVSYWTVHVLCEGNLRTAIDGESDSDLTGAHYTKHEGYKVTLPKDEFLKALPWIRAALKIASVATSCAVGGAANLEPLCKALENMSEINERLSEAENALSDRKNAAKIPSGQEEIISDFQQLRTLLAKKLPADELERGEFGGLSLMWSPKTKKQAWVCDNPACRSGLVGINDENADPLARVAPVPVAKQASGGAGTPELNRSQTM